MAAGRTRQAYQPPKNKPSFDTRWYHQTHSYSVTTLQLDLTNLLLQCYLLEIHAKPGSIALTMLKLSLAILEKAVSLI